MRIGTKFPVAIHVLLSVEVFKDERKVTSDFIAGSVNTNPVVIRRIMGLLRDAGLIEIAAGTGGIRLTRPAGEITLLDVYRASAPKEGPRLFKLHENTAARCPVGGNIRELLDGYLSDAQTAMENKLKQVTLGDLLGNLRTIRNRKQSSASPEKAEGN